MRRLDYKTAMIEKKAFIAGEATRDGIISRNGLSPRAFERLMYGETHINPPKARTKSGVLAGEDCGRSKAKEKDVKMILFYKGLFTELEMEKIVEGRIKSSAIGRIWRKETWLGLQKGCDGVKKEITELYKGLITKKALREAIKVEKIKITLELRDIKEDITVIKKRIKHLKRGK